jgi:6-pyruvoyltetrahydropterin/6-carboxytetrahydropterin synthase
MIIRKKFSFRGQHIVRNCSSERCKKSIHGHSYVVEVFIKAKGFDNGMMVMDFGLMKGNIKDFIDSFDHCYSIWSKEPENFKTFMKENSYRWIEMPVSPSAEAYSLMFFKVIDEMLKHTRFSNGEQGVELHSVRVHETTTGYAESFREDLDMYDIKLEDIKISDAVKAEWKAPLMYDNLIAVSTAGDGADIFINPIVEQQV